MGHVLHGRFTSILVDKASDVLELCRYIVLNPVRATVVAKLDAWPWSSYPATAGTRRAPEWLAVPAVLRRFARSKRVSQRAYRQCVRDGRGQPSPWAQVRGQIFLGDAAFVERVARLVRRPRLANVPAAQTRPTRLTRKEVLARVGNVYGVGLKGM